MEDKEIHKTCEIYNITNYKINNGLVDVNTHINLRYKKLTELPLNFGTINGNFDCNSNELTTLKGCPKIINGFFSCSFNRLTSLENGPSEVDGFYSATDNYLTDLVGLAKQINGDFYGDYNLIYTTKGSETSWITGHVILSQTPIYEIYQHFHNAGLVENEFLSYLIEPPINGKKPKINLDELNEFLIEKGIKPVTELKNYN